MLRAWKRGADGDGECLREVIGLADGADAAQGAESETWVEGCNGLVDESEVVENDCRERISMGNDEWDGDGDGTHCALLRDLAWIRSSLPPSRSSLHRHPSFRPC